MRVLVVSDLHLRIADARDRVDLFAGVDADVAVVAGDMTDGLEGLRMLGKTLAQRMDVVCVLGNHDLYGEDMTTVYATASDVVSGYDRLHLLQDSDVVLGGVRFCGSTLWTDYKLFEDRGGASAQDCMRAAKRTLGDYDEIYAKGVVDGRMGRLLTGRDTVGYHQTSRRYLERALSAGFDGKTVVVSHHAVSHKCISEVFSNDMTSAAYASNLDDLVETSGAALWVHGHVHHSVDFKLGKTRVLCNARGYGTNAAFDGNLIVEL